MLNVLRAGKKATTGWLRASRERSQRQRLASLYDPDAGNLDRAQHIREAVEWLKRAQDSGVDRGVSYGVLFGANFDVSYPETTGYICQTFVEHALRTGDEDLLRRAIQMGDWEIAVQMPDGAVMGGKVNPAPTPAVFNTGMVLLGWSALIFRTAEERFRSAAARASEWLLSTQESDGRWLHGNSRFANPSSTLYNVMAAWGLCEAGVALGEIRYVEAAVRNAEYCLSRQHENGWLPDCCLTESVDEPLLHTLAYAMQGLLGVGTRAGKEDLIGAARKLADAEICIMSPDGQLPGRQRQDFTPGARWCCLTGSAQTSAVWSQLYLLTKDEKYRGAARRVNDYLLAPHDIRNPDPGLRGGLPGSWPVWGDYGPYQILNWATKFLVDALALEDDILHDSAANSSMPHAQSSTNPGAAANEPYKP